MEAVAVLATGATQIRALPVPPPAEAALATACLSASEHRLMAKHRHPRRRSEFAAGRLAVKQALLDSAGSAVRICPATPLQDALLPAARRLQVLPDERGRPRLWLEDIAAPTQLSIAHAAGWAAAACSQLPIGVDVVDIDAPTAGPDDPWLIGIEPDWHMRLRALLWGIRECLLKTGQISAKTLWSLNDVRAVPTRPASEIIACWPQRARLMPLAIQVEGQRAAGAFVLLNRSAMLVMVSMPAPQR
jgi:phosphopantetheinyl transferase (holo-ACP synthase)